MMRRHQITRVFLQKLLLESNQSLYLSLLFWLLWCIESHQKQGRRRHQRPLEDDSKTTKRSVMKCQKLSLSDTHRHNPPPPLLKRHQVVSIKVLNMRLHWPAGSPILPRGTRDVIWKTWQTKLSRTTLLFHWRVRVSVKLWFGCR